MPWGARARKYLRWLILAGVALVIGAMVYGLAWSGLLNLVWPNASVALTGSGRPGLSVISDRTGLMFPAGCRVLHSKLECTDFFGSEYLIAELELPADEVQGFAASVPPLMATAGFDGAFHDVRAPRWWRPPGTARVRGYFDSKTRPDENGWSYQGLVELWLDRGRLYLVWSDDE
jgi:hypothetical protein